MVSTPPDETTPQPVDWADVGARISNHPAVRRAVTDATTACQARRTRVLSHPEIAVRLMWPPLDFTQPEIWNGYVPPLRDPDGGLNRSVRRQALMDILAAVIDAEHAASEVK